MSVTDQLEQWVPEPIEPLVSSTTFGQFLSVGVVGAVVDTSVLTVGMALVGLSELWAKALGIEAAVVVMFLLNERWTFTNHGTTGVRAFLGRLGRSHLVRSGGVAVQLAAFWLLLWLVSVELVVAGVDLWVIAASLLSIAVAMFVNYICEGLFTWEIQGAGSETTNTAESAD